METANESDLVVLGIEARSAVGEFLFGNDAAEISDRIEPPTLLVAPENGDETTPLRRLLAWLAG